jgi:HEPN domain-containing protein
MINIDKQIAYWRQGACEDWEVAQELVDRGRIRHGLFFAHLALEKMLKAHVCKQTRDLAPRTHDLIDLAKLTGLDFGEQYLYAMGEINRFNVEGRYPGFLPASPTQAQARCYVQQAQEILLWLTNQL